MLAEVAFDSYNKCAVDQLWNASAEQQAVFNAFTAIGHPGSGFLSNCF